MPFFSNVEEEELVRVAPGTPSGEVFRRYWLPVEVSANLGRYVVGGAGPRNPIQVKMLGEDLILYRDASGKPGLLAEHCSHRGTSLFYGRVEENCIRCLYHGWAYDQAGNVIDTPAEPPHSNFKLTVKHPSYPVREVGGLIFTYMGPPEKEPVFPKYEHLFREDGVRVVGNGGYIEECNVFQAMHDNDLDPWHNQILHGWFRGTKPRNVLEYGPNGEPPPLKWDRTPWGTRYVNVRPTRGGTWEYHENNLVFPTQRCKGTDMKWAVPMDDYRTRWICVDFYPFGPDGKPAPSAYDGDESRSTGAITQTTPQFSISHVSEKLPYNWIDEVGAWWNLGHPWRQGNIWEDEVAQRSQGPAERHYLPDWEKFHLGTSDRGMVLTREVWKEQIERVKQGLDPIGVIRDPEEDRYIRIPAAITPGLELEEAMRQYNMTAMERLRWLAEQEHQDYCYLT